MKDLVQLERKKQVKGKIEAKFCYYKGKQHVLNEARRQKREEIHVCKDLPKAAVAISKQNLEEVEALRHQGNTMF